eukprot:383499_1
MEPQQPLMAANMTKNHSSSILFKKLVSIENDEVEASFNYNVSNKEWIKDKSLHETEEKIEIETKIYSHGQKLDCQHPDHRSRWIKGIVVKEKHNKIQVHYDGIGNDLQYEDLDEYIADSDEDEWFDTNSTKISKLATRTISPILLAQPIYLLNKKYNPLIYIKSLNIILYQGYNEDIDYSSYSDSDRSYDDESFNINNNKPYFIQSYNINNNKYEKFMDYPKDYHNPSIEHIHYIFDSIKCNLYVWSAQMISIFDVMNKKWLKIIKLKENDYVEDETIENMIKRNTCYLSYPMDELHFYVCGLHMYFRYDTETNNIQSHKLGNMNAMIDELDDENVYELYRFDSTNSTLIYNRFIHKLFWFKFNTQSIYYCHIIGPKMICKDALWRKYGLNMPYKSSIQRSNESESEKSQDSDEENGEIFVDDDAWCIVPCFEGELIFLFYFAQNINEIWVMDVDEEKWYKSEKHLDVNVNFMENETISMVHGGDFIYCIDYGQNDYKHFKMRILDVLPQTLMRLNSLAPCGFIREYNQCQTNIKCMVPDNIMQVILHFYARFLFHINFI